MRAQQQGQPEGPFVFTKENMAKAQYHIAKYPEGRQASAVLPLLDIAQRQSGGWVPRNAIEAIAEMLKMPVIRVFEVASFYTMVNLKPVGKYHLQLCGTTPCWLRGAADLKERCQKVLDIEEGEVTVDGKFSLVEVECLGACVNAPMVQINDDFYEDLTPEHLEKILNELADDRLCPPGSQIGRQGSAPEGYPFGEVAPAKKGSTPQKKSEGKPKIATESKAKTKVKQAKGDADAS
ncbi:NADH-quinone oxidoreductase subunit NuoE [Candidatus Paracaedibacter symbiosus]|uniref:NADH-quinone oxidoreductase subunit NuoE n=1 Tax=Candidatus Paracaedibacter symbiosus TaxID=244582 RepID=UPI0009FD56FC|nr:NADH-quinone oxidoreductase subunit NuoE [Candidatus Paracaedibacter symbiosus]